MYKNFQKLDIPLVKQKKYPENSILKKTFQLMSKYGLKTFQDRNTINETNMDA